MSTGTQTPAPPTTEPRPPRKRVPAWKRPFQVLEFDDFRYLWISSLPGTMAMQAGITARGYLAYDISGSAASVGVVSMATALPMLVFALFGGVAADRFRKRNILIITQSLQLTAALFTALLVLTGIIEIWQLAVVSVLTGTGMAFNMPARQSFVAQVVPRDRITNAVALQMSGMNFSRVIGPALAGGLIVIPFIGVGGTFLILAAMFLTVIISLIRIKNPGEPAPQDRVSPLRSIADGLSYVRHSPVMVTLLMLAFIPMFLGNPYQQLMPVFAQDVFNVSAAGLGILLAMSGVGSLIGSLLIASTSGIARRGLLQMALGMTFGGALAAFAFSPTYIVGLVFIFVVGFAQAGYQALNNTLVISTADPAYRGRVMSLFHITNAAAPLAILPIGILIDMYSAPPIIGIGGILLLLLVFLVATFHPAYKRIG